MKTKFPLPFANRFRGIAAPKLLGILAVIGVAGGAIYYFTHKPDAGSNPTTTVVPPASNPPVQEALPSAGETSNPAPVAPAAPSGKEQTAAAKALEENPYQAKKFQESEAIQAWAKSDPAGLLNWLATVPLPQNEDESPAGIPVAISEWCKADMKACASWFGANQTYKYYDHGVKFLVEKMTPVDLEGARNWLATIQNDGVRSKAASLLIRQLPRPTN